MAIVWRKKMLKALRKKLTLICTLITAAILSLMSLLSLALVQKQYKAQQYTLLENHLNTLVFRLQTEKVISHPFLSELEATHHLLISIEYNNKPLLFKGSSLWKARYQELIRIAQNLAVKKYDFIDSSFSTATTKIPTTSFEFYTPNNEHYLALLTNLSINNDHYKIILLKNLYAEDGYILRILLLFILFTIIGFVLLGVFSFWFSGHATLPIEQSQKRQREFVAAASHELRSPLTVINTNLSALQLEPESNNAHFTEIIHKECSRMKRLIDDLLLLANFDASNWPIQTKATEMDTFLIETYELFRVLSKEKGFHLTIELPETPVPTLKIDQERIQQTIAILLNNAFTYTPPGGTLSFVLLLQKEALCLQVIDHGPGIPDTHKAHIFERFYQVDPSRHDKNHYGLGLSIAYEILLLHKGKILLSDTQGGGCTFTLYFPFKS